MSDDMERVFRRLECALAERDRAAVPDGLASLIDDAFLEFGASGRRWDREETLAVLDLGVAPRPVEIERFDTRHLAADVILATYELAVTLDADVRRSLRSSIWVRRDGRWRLAFHQGTPVP